MECWAEFQSIKTNSAQAFPFRNSTFKRAWISRLMYQKTFGGQLAVAAPRLIRPERILPGNCSRLPATAVAPLTLSPANPRQVEAG